MKRSLGALVAMSSLLLATAVVAADQDEDDVRRITVEEHAELGPSQLVLPVGWTANLLHLDVRSAYDPTEEARVASLAGAGGGMLATVAAPVAIVSVALSAGIIALNEPNEIKRLRMENAKEFSAMRAALGDYDCRLQLARELDWALSKAHPWLKIERVRVTDDVAPGLARAYAGEPVDTLVVVDARCGLSADLGDARIEVSVEIFSKRFGPLAHAIKGEDGAAIPVVWHEEPVYRNKFVGRISMPTAEISAARIAAKKTEIEANYAPRLAEARTKERRTEVEKWHKAALASAEVAGRISYDEYIELARAHWRSGEPTELKLGLDRAAKLVAETIAEDLSKPPQPKSKRKKNWVQKRPVLVEAKDEDG